MIHYRDGFYGKGSRSQYPRRSRIAVVAVAPGVGNVDDVSAVLLQRDDILVAVVEFHQIEFVLTRPDDLDALELFVELFAEVFDRGTIPARFADDTTVFRRAVVAGCRAISRLACVDAGLGLRDSAPIVSRQIVRRN